MNRWHAKGFTIIETMLFLAITGALIAGVLIGAGTSVTNQRYRDSVESLKSLIQAQYSELGSIKNDRANTLACDANATPVSGSQYRGQSDCVIVGRYMVIDRSAIAIYTVLANKKATVTANSSDIAYIRANYVYNVTSDVDKSSVEWGAQLAWPSSGTGAKTPTSPRTIGILFIRSPETGSVYTFSSDTAPTGSAVPTSSTFTNMMVAGSTIPGRGERTMCVQSGGVTGGDRAVYIAPMAASAGAIETRTNETTQLLGGDSKC